MFAKKQKQRHREQTGFAWISSWSTFSRTVCLFCVLIFMIMLLALRHCIVQRFTKERLRFVDDLEIMKFVCKDVWQELFQHQADKLQTNHAVNGCFSLLLSV